MMQLIKLLTALLFVLSTASALDNKSKGVALKVAEPAKQQMLRGVALTRKTEDAEYYEAEEAEEEAEEEVEEEVEEEIEYYEEEAEEEIEYYAEEAEEEIEYYEEEVEGYYNSTGSHNRFKDYQSQLTNKVNESYLPEGYYLTETQLTLIIMALFASVTALIIIAYKQVTAGSGDSDYVRSDLLKNEAGVTA